MLGRAIDAATILATENRRGVAAADRAMLMTRVPIHERTRVSEDCHFTGRQLARNAAQIFERRDAFEAECREWLSNLRHVDREMRDALVDAQQQRLRLRLEIVEQLGARPCQCARFAELYERIERM